MDYIPNTPKHRDEAHDLIQRSYIAMANAYIRELEDYPPAMAALDSLDKRYPNNVFRAEGLYLRYLAHVKQDKNEEAKRYAQQLLQQYPDTKWAQLVRPSNDNESGIANNAGIAEYYDQTYELLMNHDYATALTRSQQAKKQFTDVNYGKRFLIIEGASLANTGNYATADTMLKNFIATNPADTLKRWAEAILKYIDLNRPKIDTSQAGGSTTGAVNTTPSAADNAANTTNPTGGNIVAATDTTKPPTALPVDKDIPGDVPKVYTYTPSETHYVIFVFPQMEPRAVGVRAALADFNKFRFSSLGLSSELVVFRPSGGVIVTKAFRNVSEARVYMSALRSANQVFREYKPDEYQLIMISVANFAKLQSEQNVKPYLQFYNANYK